MVDEIHSFDRGMFAVLKAILQNFDVPVLCMTASLPSLRREELVQECGLTLYDEKPGRLAAVAGAVRYRVCRIEGGEVHENIRKALAQNACSGSSTRSVERKRPRDWWLPAR